VKVSIVIYSTAQTGEWVIAGGYPGEVVTAHRAVLAFAPDRGMTRSFIGRAFVRDRSQSQRDFRDRRAPDRR
jgi:hypothetical protein